MSAAPTARLAALPVPAAPVSARPDADRHPAVRRAEETPSVSAAEFTGLFRGHPGGVAVITAAGEDGPAALTATSVSSVSVDPPLLVFSVSSQSSAAPTITAAESVVVHLVDADDLAVARLAATSGVDRFADRSQWAPLVTGEPVYRGVRGWIRAAVVSRIEAGTATVVVARALQTGSDRPEDAASAPLVYHSRTWHRLDDASVIEG